MAIGQKETRKIETTKRGFPAMWESGGGMTNTGHAQIIAGRNGEAIRPVYVPKGYSCGEHALFTVHEGYHVISVGRHGRSYGVSIWKILKVVSKDINGSTWEASADMELVNHYDNGEWDVALDPKFEAAVSAAKSKSASYHCRSTYFIDSSPKPEASDADKARREAEMKRQDAERAKLRQEKADAEAKAKADAEATSAAAKHLFVARLEAVGARLIELGCKPVILGDAKFKWDWQEYAYLEQNVASLERCADETEKRRAEALRVKQVRDEWEPKFLAFAPRAEALGLKMETNDSGGSLSSGYTKSYSAEGLLAFAAELSAKEKEAAEVRAKAEELVRYEAKCREADASGKGLRNYSHWHRRGGATNLGDAFVIRPNGSRVERDTDDVRRYKSDGNYTWRYLFPDELVVAFSKQFTRAPFVCEVVQLPEGGMTSAQQDALAEVVAEVGIPVGEGWFATEPSERAKAFFAWECGERPAVVEVPLPGPSESLAGKQSLGDLLKKAGLEE